MEPPHLTFARLISAFLQNRAFQKVQPGTTDALKAWSPVNGADIAVVADSTPVSNALPNSLTLTVPEGSAGPVGVANEGYFGIKVSSSWEYKASFFYRTSFSGDATISLQTSSGDILGSTTASLAGDEATWKQASVKFTPTTDADSVDNQFVVTVDGEVASSQIINFALFSLFPPTFNNRENGLRIDIAEVCVLPCEAGWGWTDSRPQDVTRNEARFLQVCGRQ
ncbi:hypothetical protein AAF712_004022 [Marasmius tenuissimus]|uniref:CBM-cenC domain-containing protein n=1 Tax=Marasmius tenuissimus TaxID=585030 RepID=A0ABR3A5U5_9AGAR